MVGAGADAPYSLVYRIGGVTHDSWDYDWVDAESVLGKCKTTYAPPAVILQHCERAAKRGWRNEFFFDSHIEYDPAACAFRAPKVLPQSNST